ncbi:MAG: N-6 DNA methylase [Candidatus Melainabacteria bacterium]|nr:N-6 DNA methylase [Candidatus Melainabacteria bacterium]
MKSSEHNQLLELKRLIKAVSKKHADADLLQLNPAFLSTIVSIISLDVLVRNNCLRNLNDDHDIDLSSLKREEIYNLAQRLYERTRDLAPPSAANAMPPPLPLTTGQWHAFKQFFKATEELPLFASEISISHAYQLCSQLRRKEALNQVQSSNKQLNVDALISFTQLYTPQWVVETLIAQCLATSPDSTKEPATQLNVIDPACGAGNFLLPAFDALLNTYCAQGMSESEAVEHLSRGALSGVDIDPHGIWITSLALTVRCLRLKTPKALSFQGIQLLERKNSNESILGTLDRSFDSVERHPLSRRYSAVITNPPYIGRKLLSRELKQLLREHYPDDSHDISVAFTRRSLELLKESGRLGLITQSSILYLPSSKQFRQTLIEDFSPILVVEAGTGVFPLQSGEKIDSVIMVIERKTSAEQIPPTLFINLRQEKEKAQALISVLQKPDVNPLAYKRSIQSFRRFPNSQFNYACPDAAVTLFEKLPPLADYAEVRQGLATTDNDRFVRYMWDVRLEEINAIWFPYVKGAGSQRWWSPVLNVVKWQDDGFEIKEAVKKAYPYLKGNVHWVVKNEKYYFREGLSFSFVNNSNFAVRLLPAGCIFDVAASALFPVDIDRYALLAFLNSSFAGKMAHLINPTINFQVGDVKRLPIVPFNREETQELAQLAALCVEATEGVSRQRDFHIIQLLQPVDAHKAGFQRPAPRGSLFKAYKDHCTSVVEEWDRIQETELKIDAVVLKALERQDILKTADYADLEKWIARGCKGKKDRAVAPLSAREFAERWLCSILLQKLVIEKRALMIGFREMDHVDQLALSGEEITWLEDALQIPVSDWICKEFQNFQRREFFYHPPATVSPTADSDAKLIGAVNELRSDRWFRVRDKLDWTARELDEDSEEKLAKWR